MNEYELMHHISRHRQTYLIMCILITVGTLLYVGALNVMEYSAEYDECLDDTEKHIGDDTKFKNAVLLCDKKYYPNRVND